MPLIAIVDDSATIRRFVAVLLGDRYDTVEFPTGTAAVEGLPDALPDLVLLDIELPDLNGPEVLERLRANDRLRTVPVIAFTGHAEPADIERFAALGFSGHVAKPIVDADAFYAEVDRLLAT